MRRIHLPVWLDGASKPRAGTFVILFSLEAWSRATLITLVPLQAHQLFGDAQSVSVLYFSISIAGLLPRWLFRSLCIGSGDAGHFLSAQC